MATRITAAEAASLFASPSSVDDLGGDAGGVLLIGGTLPSKGFAVPRLLPRVVVLAADAPSDSRLAHSVDVVATGEDLDAVLSTIDGNPQAATSLALLLRGAEGRSVADGLHAESVVYGVLQAGEEFARWRASNPARDRAPDAGPAVRLSRRGDILEIELQRPAVRNALDAELRDALAEALLVALADPSLRVELCGAGPTFCSGGHLDEFGTRADPPSAHLIRMSRSVGWLLHQLAQRTSVAVHGPCRGSGVELPAFAQSVTATPDASFALPEIGMGLIPGAGGTVSLPRRIGRQRTALLALTGRPIDAPTALQWGLVDRVVG